MLTLDQGGATIGRRRLLRPPPDLLPFVELISIERRTAPPLPGEEAWRIVPDGHGHLLYQAADSADGGGTSQRLIAVGARSRPLDVDVRRRFLTVGIRLWPGALPALVDTTGAELVDRSVELEALEGSWILPLVGRLDEARERELHARARGHLRPDDRGTGESFERALYEAVVELTRSLLVRRRRRAAWATRRQRLSAAAAAIGSARVTSVADLAALTGTPQRTLHQWARRDLGFGPKRWLAIHRLHRALDLALYGGHRGWADVAAAAGFADQSHLIRSARELLRETPSVYLARRRSHLPSPAETSKPAPPVSG
ncbi:MAG TPA: helix-turn-helix domain-containing protein [Thermoanaerobaculia bacterium]|nr:helix-turn-helix domain-containing protein [Thermoanaerobaculia bacterium]